MNQPRHHELVARLQEVERRIDPAGFFAATTPEATDFALSDPFAFLVACCLDRGTRSEIIWSIPWDLKNHLGHLNAERIHSMPIPELDDVIRSLRHRPRYLQDAAQTLHGLSAMIVDRYGGDASLMWKKCSPDQFRAELMTLKGVGPHLASMTVHCVLRAFDSAFSDQDMRSIDIKADVHTRRVLYRLGVATEQTNDAAIHAARRLLPEAPGSLDAPLWWVGHNWCSATAPQCGACLLEEICPKQDA